MKREPYGLERLLCRSDVDWVKCSWHASSALRQLDMRSATIKPYHSGEVVHLAEKPSVVTLSLLLLLRKELDLCLKLSDLNVLLCVVVDACILGPSRLRGRRSPLPRRRRPDAATYASEEGRRECNGGKVMRLR